MENVQINGSNCPSKYWLVAIPEVKEKAYVIPISISRTSAQSGIIKNGKKKLGNLTLFVQYLNFCNLYDWLR